MRITIEGATVEEIRYNLPEKVTAISYPILTTIERIRDMYPEHKMHFTLSLADPAYSEGTIEVDLRITLSALGTTELVP